MKKFYTLATIILIYAVTSSNTVLSQQLNKDVQQKSNINKETNAGMLAGTYTFSSSKGTYADLKGATSLSGGLIWDYTTFTCPIGFTFKFFNVPFDTVFVADPNDIQFGTVMGKYFITAYGSDLCDRAFGDGTGKAKSPISYLLVDTTPNRILKIEWKNAGFLAEMTDSNTWTNFMNVQLWFYETTNNIEVHFGPSNITYKSLIYEGNSGPNVSINNNVNSKYYCLVGDSSKPTVSTIPEQYMTGTPPNGMIYKFDAGYVNSINHNSAGNFLFYPNPVKDELHIKLPVKSEWTDVQVFNLLGIELLNRRFVNTDQINLGINFLPQGSYLIKLQNSETSLTHKFSKQ